MPYKYRLSQVNQGVIYSVMSQFVQRNNFHVAIHKELIIIIFVLSPGLGLVISITGLHQVQTPLSHKGFLTTALKDSVLLLLLHFLLID